MFLNLILLAVLSFIILSVVKNILLDNLKKSIEGEMINIKNVTISTLKYNDGITEENRYNYNVNTLQNIYNGIKGYVAFYDPTGDLIDFKGERTNKEIIPELLNTSLNIKSLLNFNNERGFAATYVYPIYMEGEFIFNLLVQEDYVREYEELNNTISKIRIILFIVFIVITIFLSSLTDKIVQPLKSLNDEMKRYGRGEVVEDLVVTSRDEIGEVTKTFNYMKREKDELQKSSREFFNNATHELKTPVTSIYSYVQILKDNDYGTIDEAFRTRALDRMSLECVKLKELVQKILDVSRGTIEKHKDREIVKVNELVEDLSDSLGIRCNRFSRNILLNLDEVKIEAVKSDLEEIILNLLDNAIKYSSSEEINVLLSKDVNYKMKLEIVNETKNIPENIKLRLLEPFVKYNNGNARNENEISSSGLGLYLCTKLAQANDMEFNYELNNNIITFTLVVK